MAISAAQYLGYAPPAVTPARIRERLRQAFELLPTSIVLRRWDLPRRPEEAVAQETERHPRRLMHKDFGLRDCYATIGCMNSTIKAIIFDFGNVLLEWDPRNVYNRYFPDNPEGMEHFLREVKFMDWNLQQDKGRPFAEGVAVLSQEFPHHSDLIRAYHDHWIDSVGRSIAGTVAILKALKQAAYPLYGLSNWSAETFPSARARYDFFDLFDDIVISGEVGHVKPDPEIFEILLDKIGRPAPECLLIDDSLPNIHQANKMGFATIHFGSPPQLEKELTQLRLL